MSRPSQRPRMSAPPEKFGTVGAAPWYHVGGVLKLHVSRETVETTYKSGSTSTKAVVALSTDERRTVVIAVGETSDDLDRNINPLKAPVRPTLLHPGADPWWDANWRWPPSAPVGGPLPAASSQVLVIWPLRKDTWSPPMADALFRYVVLRATGSGWRAALFPPPIEVAVDDDFDDTEYAELVDVLRGNFGLLHVRLPQNRKVSPPASQRMGLLAKASAWAALLFLLVLWRVDLPWKPACGALASAAVVLLTLLSTRLQGAPLKAANRRVPS